MGRGTFLGEVAHAFPGLPRPLRWVVGVYLAAASACVLVLLGWAAVWLPRYLLSGPPQARVSHDALLHGLSSKVVRARMEDNHIGFTLISLNESEKADQKILAFTVFVDSDSNYSPSITVWDCELSLATRDGVLPGTTNRSSLPASMLLLNESVVERVTIRYKNTVTFQAVFVIPSAASITSLTLALNGGGRNGFYGWQEVRFVFEP